MDFWQQFMIVLRYIVVWGILSHVLGEALPRRWFHWDRFPYRAFSWEEEGRFYERLGIRKWKGLLPDKSKHTKKTFTKTMVGHTDPAQLTRFLQETCVAELVHWCLMLLAVYMYFHVPTVFGAIVSALYGLSNVPFIMIQRYNRPRLRRLLSRSRARTC